MSSRFEPRQSRSGDPVTPLTVHRHLDVVATKHTATTDEARPWQVLIRKLRTLFSADSGSKDTEQTKPERPNLRLLPGGRLDQTKVERRSNAVTRGKWR